MTNQETKNKFAQILAEAQARAEAQASGKKVTKVIASAPKVTASAPISNPKPLVAVARVVTKDNLITRYKSASVPELSTMTIADLVGEVKPQPTADLRIVQYSDKCVVVVGNTKANKERLKAIGGKYNAYLK